MEPDSAQMLSAVFAMVMAIVIFIAASITIHYGGKISKSLNRFSFFFLLGMLCTWVGLAVWTMGLISLIRATDHIEANPTLTKFIQEETPDGQ